MMLIRIMKNDYDNISDIIASCDVELIVEVSELPVYSHTVVNDIPKNFMQCVHPGKFGEYLSIEQINEISSIKDYIGETLFSQRDTLDGLRDAKGEVETQLALTQMYELVLGGI